MDDSRNRMQKPLLVGRLLRVVAGVATLGLTVYLGVDQLSLFGVLALGCLGFSFIVSGLIANSGCEISALPNALLPEEKRQHFPCILWTPLDRVEHSLRGSTDNKRK